MVSEILKQADAKVKGAVDKIQNMTLSMLQFAAFAFLAGVWMGNAYGFGTALIAAPICAVILLEVMKRVEWLGWVIAGGGFLWLIGLI